jgi:hypothetical protein
MEIVISFETICRDGLRFGTELGAFKFYCNLFSFIPQFLSFVLITMYELNVAFSKRAFFLNSVITMCNLILY